MIHALSQLAVAYSYTTTSSSSSFNLGFLATYFVFELILYIVVALILSRVFKKAGRPGWAAFVPFYNTWTLLEMGDQSGAHMFWLFLPFIGPIIFLVFYIKAMLTLSRRFGKGTAFAIFGLVIFSLIGYIILAFNDSQYQAAPAAATPGVPDTPYPPPPQIPQMPQSPVPPVATPNPTMPPSDDNNVQPPQPPQSPIAPTPPVPPTGSVSG